MDKVGMQLSLRGRIERSWMMWVGHLSWMEVGRLPRAEAVKQPAGKGMGHIYNMKSVRNLEGEKSGGKNLE